MSSHRGTSDGTRTVSKSHARLEPNAVGWMIVDLDSTNGVVLVGEDGVETDLEPGVAAPLTERSLLGDAELHLVDRGQDASRACVCPACPRAGIIVRVCAHARHALCPGISQGRAPHLRETACEQATPTAYPPRRSVRSFWRAGGST
ncbi:MAG TPA: FHA domain-containing protein [Microbacterium sp.]|nr:FHA domain-containing protein [Microbacterium sp.]